MYIRTNFTHILTYIFLILLLKKMKSSDNSIFDEVNGSFSLSYVIQSKWIKLKYKVHVYNFTMQSCLRICAALYGHYACIILRIYTYFTSYALVYLLTF